jgi:hypothetical protein
MRQFLSILFILISTFAIGQNHFVGFQSGLNFTSVKPNEDLKNSSMKTGFIGGVTYDLNFSNRYQIGVGVLYSQQGFNDQPIFVEGENVNVLDEKIKIKYDYLSIPIKIGYEMGNKIKIIPKIGITPAILVNAKHEDYVSKFDFGGLIEVGVENDLSENIILFSALSYKQSLTNYFNSDYFDRYDDTARKHFGFSLSLGLKYRL